MIGSPPTGSLTHCILANVNCCIACSVATSLSDLHYSGLLASSAGFLPSCPLKLGMQAQVVQPLSRFAVVSYMCTEAQETTRGDARRLLRTCLCQYRAVRLHTRRTKTVISNELKDRPQSCFLWRTWFCFQCWSLFRKVLHDPRACNNTACN